MRPHIFMALPSYSGDRLDVKLAALSLLLLAAPLAQHGCYSKPAPASVTVCDECPAIIVHTRSLQDVDEMIDYGEFGDEEYEDLALLEEVEQAMEAAHVEIKLGDRVVGMVYDIDEEGANVEIGQKYSGFVPLSECSFARLRTVRTIAWTSGKAVSGLKLQSHGAAVVWRNSFASYRCGLCMHLLLTGVGCACSFQCPPPARVLPACAARAPHTINCCSIAHPNLIRTVAAACTALSRWRHCVWA